jgi:hypothetical protein
MRIVKKGNHMNPENQQVPTPQPIQPQPAPVPPFQPAQPVTPAQPTPQPSAFPQPAATTQALTGLKPPTTANIEKQKKIALGAAILSIVIFIVGLIAGYVFAAAAFLGAYAIAIGIRANPKPKLTIALGSVGLVLNLGLYILSIVTK